ncbi:hypothetical protein QWY14_09375 [Planococcus sp. N028]|uniref:Uncharacterized protein n=1 Tax=Planococcus shixiaomingii TaxID=3058393 RepID=A0ABT8N290_9BACL|nr:MULTISPECIES: hypothetical protein [unclassified Planococcus (in: firmicutes)]MDN7242008.1 hypothetical protein [Planococcus sp. N028]WKA54288.1 hypothetical protein QWY21_16680 [Planococcus sp. N022]
MAKDDEKDYMKENKKTMQHPPQEKEGLEEPNVKEYNKVQGGIVAFVIVVIIIIIALISTDMFGLLN